MISAKNRQVLITEQTQGSKWKLDVGGWLGLGFATACLIVKVCMIHGSFNIPSPLQVLVSGVGSVTASIGAATLIFLSVLGFSFSREIIWKRVFLSAVEFTVTFCAISFILRALDT